MSKVRALLSRHRLWIFLLAGLVPLSTLFYFQLSWLSELRSSFASAQRSDRTEFIEDVGTEVRYFYQSSASRALNLPSTFITESRLDLAAKHFAKSGAPGARTLFVSRLLERDWTVLFFEPQSATMVRPPYGPDVRAAIRAVRPLKTGSERGDALYRTELIVDESEPDHRVIVNPIVDEDSRIVGVAGMILDEEYFRRAVLPSAIKRALTPFLREHAVVTVKDEEGGLVYTSSEPRSAWSEVDGALPFVFQDWRIGLHSRKVTPEQLARRNFGFNMGLLAAIWFVLLAAIALVLRAASREIKLSRMKSDFVSNVSHELRTPLASIRVFGEMLRLGRASSPEKVREYGEYIETESVRLGQLLSNILDFSRIESRAKVYRFDRENLQEVVEESLEAFRVRLQHEGFHVALDLRGSDLPPLEIDRQAMIQALSNMLDNAIKYSGGARFIGIKLRREGPDAVISITDKGVGISEEEQQRIFERFHRVGRGLIHDVRGSGLGLSIVKHIVAAHGGRVDVASELGRGSTFSIRLPVSTGRSAGEAPAGDGEAWGGASSGAGAPEAGH